MTIVTYCTLARFRTLSGFTTEVVDDDTANLFLTQSHRQVKREGFIKIREELITKDSNDRYFTIHKYIADKDLDGTVDTDDILVYELDSTNNLLVDISDGVDSIDGFNNYFTLATGYPTNSRQVCVTYYITKQPITELVGEGQILEEAVSQCALILTLKRIKRLRMKRGIVTWNSGGQTITHSEQDFEDYIKEEVKRYDALINRIKPFYGRKVQVGRGTSQRRRSLFQNQPLTYKGRLLWN